MTKKNQKRSPQFDQDVNMTKQLLLISVLFPGRSIYGTTTTTLSSLVKGELCMGYGLKAIHQSTIGALWCCIFVLLAIKFQLDSTTQAYNRTTTFVTIILAYDTK